MPAFPSPPPQKKAKAKRQNAAQHTMETEMRLPWFETRHLPYRTQTRREPEQEGIQQVHTGSCTQLTGGGSENSNSQNALPPHWHKATNSLTSLIASQPPPPSFQGQGLPPLFLCLEDLTTRHKHTACMPKCHKWPFLQMCQTTKMSLPYQPLPSPSLRWIRALHCHK